MKAALPPAGVGIADAGGAEDIDVVDPSLPRHPASAPAELAQAVAGQTDGRTAVPEAAGLRRPAVGRDLRLEPEAGLQATAKVLDVAKAGAGRYGPVTASPSRRCGGTLLSTAVGFAPTS
jgi:hypothetical protein